jgi:hypothetical protein
MLAVLLCRRPLQRYAATSDVTLHSYRATTTIFGANFATTQTTRSAFMNNADRPIVRRLGQGRVLLVALE